MRYTKGPWVIGSSVEGEGAHIFSETARRSVAWVAPWPSAIDEETGRAIVAEDTHEHPDMRLIAAAPELYAALREMTFYFSADLSSPLAAEMRGRVLAALSRVDGGAA